MVMTEQTTNKLSDAKHASEHEGRIRNQPGSENAPANPDVGNLSDVELAIQAGRLKRDEHGYLVVPGNGKTITSEMVKAYLEEDDEPVTDAELEEWYGPGAAEKLAQLFEEQRARLAQQTREEQLPGCNKQVE